MQNKLFKEYIDGDFVRYLKAKALFYLLALTIFMSVVTIIVNFLNVSIDEVKELLVPIIVLDLFLITSLVLLYKGCFQVASNMAFFATYTTIWYVIFSLHRHPLAVIGTIVYVYGALTIAPLMSGKKIWIVLFHFVFNMCMAIAFMRFNIQKFNFDSQSINTFLFDNLTVMFFVALISYLVIYINEKAIERAESEIEKNKLLSESLETQVEDRTKQLKVTQDDLLSAAHQAGKAEIATGVLHNIGNTLTGVFVNVDTVKKSFSDQLLSSIQRVSDAVEKEENNPNYFVDDDQGKKIPSFIVALGPLLKRERERMDKSLARIDEGISLIKESVRMQQAYANSSFMLQDINLSMEAESMMALTISNAKRNGVKIEKNYNQKTKLVAQKEKVGHIIANLLKNAFEALEGSDVDNRLIKISIYEDEYDNNILEVSDSGCGIEKEFIDKIFSFGFTTKKDGHGFGLHHCANAMTEMNGKLSVASNGPGQGATFKMTFYRGKRRGDTRASKLSDIRPDLTSC